MGEKINLKPVSGKKLVEVNLLQGEKVQLGLETKYRHEAVIEKGSKKRKINLFERKNEEWQGATYVDKWKMFKDAGFPVVPTLRQTEDGRLFMTDITADGSEIYGKGIMKALEDALDSAKNPKQKIPEQIKHIELFMKVIEEKFDEIKTKVEEYRKRANEKKLCLPVDDPFEFILHPDGTWELMMLDLNAVFMKETDYWRELYNSQSTARFVNDLLKIKELYKAIAAQSLRK